MLLAGVHPVAPGAGEMSAGDAGGYPGLDIHEGWRRTARIIVAAAVGIGLVMLAAGPRQAAREFRRQAARVGLLREQPARCVLLTHAIPLPTFGADAAPVTGTLSLANQRTPGSNREAPGPTWAVGVRVGNIGPFIARIFLDTATGAWAYAEPFCDPPIICFVPDPRCAPGEIAFAYGILDCDRLGRGAWPPYRVLRLTASTRDPSLRFSVALSPQGPWVQGPAPDAEAVPGRPWVYSASIGDLSWSGTQSRRADADGPDVAAREEWEPNLRAPEGARVYFMQQGGVAGKAYAAASLRAGKTALDFTGCVCVVEDFALEGSGPNLVVRCTASQAPAPATPGPAALLGRALIRPFSRLGGPHPPDS
jgi:hypothetical protein